MFEIQIGMYMQALPSVSFVILAAKDAGRTVACVESLVIQEYPENLLELVLVDGQCRGLDEIALKFNARLVRCEDGSDAARLRAGVELARGELVFTLGSDAGLSRTDWLKLMIKPFLEHPEVSGAFTQMVSAPTDPSFARYVCGINGNPFSWFVHGDACNPRYFRGLFKPLREGGGHVVYRFSPGKTPVLDTDHGCGIRISALPDIPHETHGTTPFDMVMTGGLSVALVQDAGIYHLNPDSLSAFVSDCMARLRGGPDGWPAGPAAGAGVSWWTKTRRYLFLAYGLTAIMPLIDSLWLSLLERSASMFWHGPASIIMSWLVLIERIRR